MSQSSSFIAQADAYRAGTSSPVELLETCLERIAAREGEVQAFVQLAIDAARHEAEASAARWREGNPLSPIDGMPVGIKDIIETADMPTGQGSPLWTGFESKRDSATVQALRDAGAIILGKTTTTEFAASVLFAKTVNPHDPSRTPGGSSSGSCAAVGAGFVPMALGSQVVGSILRPSSFCGCFGFKPTFGGINRGGSYDYFSHSSAGLIGAALEDVWVTVREIVKRTGGDPGHVGVTGPDMLPQAKRPARLIVLETDGWSRATDGAKAAFQDAASRLEEAGVELVTRVASTDLDAFEREIAEVRDLSNTILSWEARWPLGGYVKRGADKLSDIALGRFRASANLTQADYIAALGQRRALRDAYAALLGDADGAVTLAAPGAAPVGFANTGDAGFNIPASILGVPAISLPVLKDEKLPLGLQIMGKANEDADMFAVARWVMSLF